jgi:hypothetical protein
MLEHLASPNYISFIYLNACAGIRVFARLNMIYATKPPPSICTFCRYASVDWAIAPGASERFQRRYV